MEQNLGNLDQELNQRREKFLVPIRCECGQVGSAIWEENTNLSPKGPRPVLVEVSSGFYFRVMKKDICRTEIVCAICEGVVVD